MSLTDRPALERLKLKFGGTICSQEDGRQPHYKRQWHWTLSKQADLEPVLEALLPRLQVKFLEAEALLTLVKHCRVKPKGVGTGGKAGPVWDAWRAQRDLLQERVKQMREAVHVLAIDPGERAGWARGAVIKGVDGHELIVLDHGIAALKDMALAVYKATWRYQVIAYETFILTHRGAKVMVGSDLQTAQLVGMIRLSAWINPAVQLVPQGPAAKASARKSMRTHPSGADIQERLAKLPKSHDLAHDGDALLHLYTWFFERFV